MPSSFSYTAVLAFAEAGDNSDGCSGLSSHISLEFMKLDLQCRLIPLKALVQTQDCERVEDRLCYQPNYDIECELTRLGRSAQADGDGTLSTLVFVVDGQHCTRDLEEINGTLKEWVEDFRINRDILGALNCAFVACNNALEPIDKEVTASLLTLQASLAALGAHILIDHLFRFDSSDVGQIVTFTNMVKEACDEVVIGRQLKPLATSNHAEPMMKEITKGKKRNRRSWATPRAYITPQQDDDDTSEGPTDKVEHECCRDALTDTQGGTCNCVETSSNTLGGTETDNVVGVTNDGADEVTPVEYISASDYESSDDPSTGNYCGTEEDLENLGEASRKMVSDTQRKALTKQGYRLIGDHSAIKLCRWTKSRVRGHGGCYKHTFYGIRSNQCMEMTPSLACANKCVFCWRHHTNPVATRWKWPMDDAEFVTEESVKAHLKLVKELRGILDAKSERFTEALQVRHCALSLVGEPIMYPQINELLNELHQRHISTFLVTNAQFPRQMENLTQVTQLYVSIDAADKTSLKDIDRPLFRDYWGRFKRCIQLLKHRRERTIFRLTLVKHFNISEQQTELCDYAQLIELGEPDFVEIKAVTFCGTVHDNAITMQNIPWHDEVIKFAQALVEASQFTQENYGIACEHRHSCCVLVAKKRFHVNGTWHTWIDYDQFHQLAISGQPFDGLEYSAETPEWALFGSKEEGFDPVDTRVYTKGRRKLPGPPETEARMTTQ